MNLIRLADLRPQDIRAIWQRIDDRESALDGTVACSFEGNGVRTRTSFTQVFRELGLSVTELPNLLKTTERVGDLAGYLDPFYDLYVVRESNHTRLAEFAAVSRRPVINAMSSEGHPCEVLTDAYYVETALAPLQAARICLWGPPSNVMNSWHELAEVLDFPINHRCDERFHEAKPNVRFSEPCPSDIDLVVTDAWPSGAPPDPAWSLTLEHLARMGYPKLLPTPPFLIGRELAFDPLAYRGFVGYAQKELLVPVQKAILLHATQGR